MAWKAAGARTPPPGLRCFTPLPVIQPLGLPEIFDAPAKLFGNVCIYSTRSFYDGIWVSKGSEYFCSSAKSFHASSDAIEDIRSYLISGCILLNQKSIPEAFAQLDKDCSNLKEIVRAEDPMTLGRVVEMTVLVKAFGHTDLVRVILRQLAEMSAIILSTPQHPLCKIFATLCRLDLQHFDEVALRAWECMNDVFYDILGPSHLNTITSKLDRLDTAVSSLDPQ